MKKSKKIAVLGLSAVLAMAVFAGCPGDSSSSGTGATTGTAADPGRPSTPQGRIVVGVNAMNADFFDGWTNLVGNADAKAIINGYGTVIYTDDDRFIPDPVVVRSLTTTDNADGGKTYTIELNTNLVWNDGTPITARDYVFGILLSYSPFLREMGNQSWVGGDNYQGFAEYNSGATDVFTGARLLGDYSFSMTVAPVDGSGEPTFPFWFEITYAGSGPSPLHVLAPGCSVEDTGTGVRMTGPWSLQLLQSTLDNGSTGYRYTPYVTAGPYKFVSFDAGSYTTTLEVNDRFLGRGPDRDTPAIRNLIFFQVGTGTEIDSLRSGQVDLILGSSGATVINAGLDLVDAGIANYATYARNGFGRITFQCDWGPTQFEEVRRAVAWSMDREEFVRQYTGGFGVIMHSRIGSAQWTYSDNRAALERDLTVYTLNLDRAREELDNGGWTLNAQGGPYTGSGVRHKRMPDGSLMALVLEWFSPDSNVIGEMLATFVTENARSVGMQLNQEWGDSTAFGNALYGIGKRYNMINGGVGFNVQDSPWYYYQPDPAMFGTYNTNFIIDEQLNRYTQDMRQTTPGDYATFSRHWLGFVLHFNRVLPDIPLYSDEYHDFFNAKLRNYTRTALYPWYYSLLKAYMVD